MRETYISVDVETSGPIPGEYSLLSIGACCVDNLATTFEARLRPLNSNADPEAMKVNGLSMRKLEQEGLEPAEAMRGFAAWLSEVTPSGRRAVFVGLNAPFDWSFVNYYFHRFTQANPFGFTALDIKAMYMGATGCTWSETAGAKMSKQFRLAHVPTHDALDDARHQAELFNLVRTLKS